MPRSPPGDADPVDLLLRIRRVTVVGASANPGKDAHDVPQLVAEWGWEILPVNPRGGTIFGKPVAPSLAEAAKPLGIVNVFRPSAEAPGVAREAVAHGASAIWLQTGIESDEARTIAREAGIPFVEDRCLKIEAKMALKRRSQAP